MHWMTTLFKSFIIIENSKSCKQFNIKEGKNESKQPVAHQFRCVKLRRRQAKMVTGRAWGWLWEVFSNLDSRFFSSEVKNLFLGFNTQTNLFNQGTTSNPRKAELRRGSEQLFTYSYVRCETPACQVNTADRSWNKQERQPQGARGCEGKPRRFTCRQRAKQEGNAFST